MTVQELTQHLSKVPQDARVMSNSGWEGCETDIGGIWYSKNRNEVHLTQGGYYERLEGYCPYTPGKKHMNDFEMIFCVNEP